jgi:hypothetical protein
VADDKTLDVGHVAARLLAVALPMGLVLDEVIIEGEGLHIEKHPFSVSLSQPGSLLVRVGAASLAAFLEIKAPGGLSGFQVGIANGEITVNARATIIITLNVGAVCKLRIEDESRLFVDLVRVESIGGTGAHNLVQRQLDSINPVMDVADLPLAARLETVEMENEWIVLRGTVAPKA